MNRLAKWLALTLVLTLGAGGWLAWQQRTWQQRFYADTAGLTLENLQWAHRDLQRASTLTDRERKAEAMAAASAHLNAAFSASMRLFGTMFPFRKGQAAEMTPHAVYALLQYARDLSPDLPAYQVARRAELVGGLAGAFRAGFTEEWTAVYESGRLDRTRLMTSLKGFLAPHAKAFGDFPAQVRFDDPPVGVSIQPNLEGNTLTLRIAWNHTYRLFPRPRHDFLLIRTAARPEVRSNQGMQDQLSTPATIPPFSDTVIEAEVRERLFGPLLPSGWTPESYQVIGILPGLNQTLTLTLPAGGTPEALLVQLYFEAPYQAVPIPIAR